MSSRRAARLPSHPHHHHQQQQQQQRSRPASSTATAAPSQRPAGLSDLHPALQQQLQQQHALTLPHPHRPLRNPWVVTADSDPGGASSSSASVPPPAPSRPSGSRTRALSRGSSLRSSSRPPSRALPNSGCCSPGAQLLCYYCLRAGLLACLLGGAALAVAGVVLRHHGRPELGVLLYIGALAALVSALLLAVQHRARRHAVRRHLRATAGLRLEPETVPLQQLAPTGHVVVIPATARAPIHTWQTSRRADTIGGPVTMLPAPSLPPPTPTHLEHVQPPTPETQGVRTWWRFGRSRPADPP